MKKIITIIRFFLWLMRHGILVNPFGRFGDVLDKISNKWERISIKEQNKVCKIFAGDRGSEYEELFRLGVTKK